ncbi:MAG: hypothetical protein ACR2J4_11010, partial [Deinococcus sp.]
MNNLILLSGLTLGGLFTACCTTTPAIVPPPSATAPIMRIVSPLGNALVSPGTGVQGTPTALHTGAGFVINLEVVTRDDVKVKVREATVGPGSTGI